MLLWARVDVWGWSVLLLSSPTLCLAPLSACLMLLDSEWVCTWWCHNNWGGLHTVCAVSHIVGHEVALQAFYIRGPFFCIPVELSNLAVCSHYPDLPLSPDVRSRYFTIEIATLVPNPTGLIAAHITWPDKNTLELSLLQNSLWENLKLLDWWVCVRVWLPASQPFHTHAHQRTRTEDH